MRWTTTAVTVAAVVLLAGPAATAAQGACGSAWSRVPTPAPGRDGGQLYHVVAFSPTDAIAVGDRMLVDPVTTKFSFAPLIERWDGSEWTVMDSPGANSRFATLVGVDGTGPSDVWVVGHSGREENSRPMMRHFDGTSWRRVPSVAVPGGYLVDVAAIGPGDVWAAGFVFRNDTVQTPLFLHWDGTSWSRVPAPVPDTTYMDWGAIDAVSSDDVWAVGGYYRPSGRQVTLIMHWNGLRWRVVPTPTVGDAATLYGVAAAGRDEAWAVGTYRSGSSDAFTLILRWDGSSWRLVPSPNDGTLPNRLNDVAVGSHGEAYAVGGAQTQDFSTRNLVERWDGRRWSLMRSDQAGVGGMLLGAAVSPGGDAWAVGFVVHPGRNSTFAERRCP